MGAQAIVVVDARDQFTALASSRKCTAVWTFPKKKKIKKRGENADGGRHAKRREGTKRRAIKRGL